MMENWPIVKPCGDPLVARFWSFVAVGDGCWEWQGTIDAQGYGAFHIAGKVIKSHRLAYDITFGEIPRGALVCHKCDNRKCVRPDHLFLGSVITNNMDKMTKGRHRALKGADHPRARLTVDQANEIKAADGSQRVLARRYGVSKSTIARIRRGESWTESP